MIWTLKNATLQNPIRFGKRHDGKEHVASSLKNFGWLPGVQKFRRSIADNRRRQECKYSDSPYCRSCGGLMRRRGGFAGYPCCCGPAIGCQNSECDTGTTPAELDLDVPSGTFTIGDDCTWAEGAFILAQNVPNTTYVGCAGWAYDFTPTDAFWVFDFRFAANNITVTLKTLNQGGTRFDRSQTTPFDCVADIAGDVPWNLNVLNFINCGSGAGKIVSISLV